MRLLFIHRSFPGQFLRLVDALVRDRGHQIVFITRPTDLDIAGVTKLTYAVAPASHRTHRDAAEFDAAMRRAQAVAEVAAGLRQAGFQPDIVIGHEGWGETLNVRDVWPGIPLLGFREYFYHEAGADAGFDPEFPVEPWQASLVRAKNAVGMLSLLAGHPGVTPTAWQRSLYPKWAQPAIGLVPDGVDLGVCRPDPATRSGPFDLGGIRIEQDQHLVTFVARDLEPYRGFHVFTRALPWILGRPNVQVICVGGDGVSYGLAPATGTWRSRLLSELDGRVDTARLHFPGRVAYRDYVRLLQRSDIHTYLSYPFIASWSLREALASGCAVVAGDTAPAREFVRHGETGWLVPPLNSVAVASAILDLLDDPVRRASLGRGARRWAEANLDPQRHLDAWTTAIERSIALNGRGTEPAEPGLP